MNVLRSGSHDGVFIYYIFLFVMNFHIILTDEREVSGIKNQLPDNADSALVARI